jgi:hypothetical protein
MSIKSARKHPFFTLLNSLAGWVVAVIGVGVGICVQLATGGFIAGVT